MDNIRSSSRRRKPYRFVAQKIVLVFSVVLTGCSVHNNNNGLPPSTGPSCTIELEGASETVYMYSAKISGFPKKPKPKYEWDVLLPHGARVQNTPSFFGREGKGDEVELRLESKPEAVVLTLTVTSGDVSAKCDKE